MKMTVWFETYFKTATEADPKNQAVRDNVHGDVRNTRRSDLYCRNNG